MLVGDYGAELVQCARRVANCALVGVCVGEYCSGNGIAEDVAQCYLLLLFLKVSELHSALKVIEDNYVCSSHGLKKDFTVHPRDINRRRTGIQPGANVLPWFSLRTTLALFSDSSICCMMS